MAYGDELIDKALTVSEINHLIKTFIKERFFNLTISGEVSTFRPSANGHWYFKLKDASSQIDAVMFRSANALCHFLPKEGDMVQVTGSIDVYEARGTYQIIVQSMRYAGLGELLLQLQKRKEYYQSLGWFESEGKPALPLYPKNIGVVTAATGAAIQDILDTTGRRAPHVDITIFPTLVQGSQAAGQIAAAIRQANELGICDVLIVGRGGGSVEDLLPFSEDEVIKAIHESEIPVISAVGHEIDTSISDYVASRKAITPTDGAMIATEGWFTLRERLHKGLDELNSLCSARVYKASASMVDQSYLNSLMEKKLDVMKGVDLGYIQSLMVQKCDSLALRLSYASDSLAELSTAKVDKLSQKVDETIKTASNALGSRVQEKRIVLEKIPESISSIMRERLLKADHRLEALDARSLGSALIKSVEARGRQLGIFKDSISLAAAGSLERCTLRLQSAVAQCESLDPTAVLKRGYAIALKEDGTAVKDASSLSVGETIDIRLYKGVASATVKGVKK